MRKNISLILGPHYESFIARQIAEGRFASATEVIEAGLRLLQERETKLTSLRRALIKGEESGISDFSLQGLIDELDS